MSSEDNQDRHKQNMSNSSKQTLTRVLK